MSNADSLGTVLWLAAGGAAGYAASRWLVAPRLSSRAITAALPQPRALAAGPSGDMRPMDPYASPTTAPVSVDGPITKPSQVDISMALPAPSGAPTTAPTRQYATSPRVRRFDSVFERYRGGIPIEYVRALVERESNGQPSARAGTAIGLMQIVPVVLDDYNKRHGTKYRREHLVDPRTNVAIGCELLRIIVDSYRKNHPRIRTLQTDWNNAAFIELLTFGWNAGFSEAGGVGRVARYLEKLGATDITIDQLTAHAKLAGASKHLSNPAKVAWCKSVAALYLRERAAARAVGTELASALGA